MTSHRYRASMVVSSIVILLVLMGLNTLPTAATPQAIANSSAFGASASLTLNGTAVITVPPTPTVAGSGPPAYNLSNSALSVVGTVPALGGVLSTGTLA